MEEYKEIMNEDGSFNLFIDFSKLDKTQQKELRLAASNIRESFKTYKAFTRCYLCPNIELVNSHLIKDSTLNSISGGKDLLTLASDQSTYLSALREDVRSMSIKRAFTFELICDSCDKPFKNFPYELKASLREPFTRKDLESIALKLHLKELYDDLERAFVKTYIPTNPSEEIVIDQLQFDARRIIFDRFDLKHILEGKKSYTPIIDTFLDFRVPFAMESYLTPEYFPYSRKKLKNSYIKRCSSLRDMPGLYVVLSPSSIATDNWSRFTLFRDTKDSQIEKWVRKLGASVNFETKDLINCIISQHINDSAKNFVMSPKINKNFLKTARHERLVPDSTPNYTIDWLGILEG